MRRKRKREDATLIADGNSIRRAERKARFPPPLHARARVRERGRGTRDGYGFRRARKRKTEGKNERENGERKR